MRASWVLLAATIAIGVGGARHGEAQVRREGEGAQPPRAELEQRVRQRFASVLQERLQLSDEQMRQLQASSRRFEGRRRTLLEQERDVRIGLRNELLAEGSANEQRVSRLLDQMIAIQRQRIMLVEEEQRELAGFLTPVQRAKYLALQDQLHRRMEDMRRQGGPGALRRGGRPAAPPR